jgi:hypothetical protein
LLRIASTSVKKASAIVQAKEVFKTLTLKNSGSSLSWEGGEGKMLSLGAAIAGY